MYFSQQHTYSEDNNNQPAKIANSNELFFIENQKLVSSIPSAHIMASSQSSSIIFDSNLLPTMGHTTHTIDNDLVSFFGKPDQPSVTIIQVEYSPPSITLPYALPSLPSSLQQLPSPSRRYAHTTTMVQSTNNTAIFLIGGSTIEDDIPQFDIWKLEWDTKKWSHLDVQTDSSIPGLMGHVTLILPRRQSTHLLTCFGANHHHHVFFQGCALFNTDTLYWKPLKHKSSVAHPAPRIYTSMIPTNDTHAVLYGGQSTSSALLDDLWWLHLDDIDAAVTFTFLGHSIPRAGHTASMLSDNLMLVHGGNYSDLGEKHDTMILDLKNQGNQHLQKRQLTLRSSAAAAVDMVAQVGSSQDGAANGLSGGAIGGIIVAVLMVLGLSTLLFVFCQRRKRRQRNYNMHSRAARFSLSTPPRPSGSDTEQRTSTVVIQHPDSAKIRISHMSFGSEFGIGLGGPDGSRSSVSLPVNPKKTSSTWGNVSTHSIVSSSTNNNNNHPNLLDSPSRQLYTNWVCETPVPTATTLENNSSSNSSNNTRNIDPRHTSMSINQSALQNTTSHDYNENDAGNVGAKKGSGTAFDRLRLSIFKPLDIVAPIADHKTHSLQYQKEQLASYSPDQSISTNMPGLAAGQTEDQLAADTAKRRSSMFGLSKFLNLGESNTGASRARDQHNQHQNILKQQLQPQQQQGRQGNNKQQMDQRESLGSKSVASLQWVEFNSEMDFSGNLTPRNLAVMNHQQSSATISSGSGFSSGLGGPGSVDDLNASSRPTSPRDIVAMAQQLQQQHRHIRQQQQQDSPYRLSQRELQSWEDARLSRLIPPSPHRLTAATPSKPNNYPS